MSVRQAMVAVNTTAVIQQGRITATVGRDIHLVPIRRNAMVILK